MKPGWIVGEIWASRRVADLAGRSLKLVVGQPDAPDASAVPPTAGLADPRLAWGSLTVAIDTLDGRAGQPVLVAYGSGARNVIQPGPDNRHVLADAAVALLVDSTPDDADNPA
mgnify:CR=1 FL=1